MRTLRILAAAGLCLIALPALAAGRTDRERSTLAPAPAPIVVPAPVSPGIFVPSHSSGTIQSHTSVSSNSGGNKGGTVTTGDQSSTISVVNIGPATNTTQVISPAPQNPAPQCIDRTCPRTR